MCTLSLYVHIPFCISKCGYCDFNSYAMNGPIVSKTVDAILTEIQFSGYPNGTVQSIFFGGGTPTFVNPDNLQRILVSLRDRFSVTPEAEITVEANPGSADMQRFADLRSVGFNRISIGVQSFNDNLLHHLERRHSAAEAVRAVEIAREAGFENINIDLMFGIPGQTEADWRESLQTALSLQTEHISLYSLTIEPKTRFEHLQRIGQLPLPDEEVMLAMYEHAIETARQAGFEHYEISNFAKLGYQCRHNVNYWHNGPYAAYGPGAVSCLWEDAKGARYRRWTNELSPRKYLQKIESNEPLSVEEEAVSKMTALGESMMVGLRMMEGVSLGGLYRRYRIDPALVYEREIAKLIERGLIQIADDRIALTRQGLLLANDVMLEFIALPDENQFTMTHH
ncbi:MAG: radical SAM family heme chaperone HemW [Armatimonadetes bacterium]|nr:radical SAM family heme chaperone HemW [Armatimonadota bacterium]